MAEPDPRAAFAPPSRPLLLAMLAAGGAWAFLAWGKWRAFLYDDLDLALFAQAANGVRHGTFFSSIRGMVWPGDHSSFVLVLLAPFTALVPPAPLLLGVQAAGLAIAAWPLYALAKRRFGHEGPALAIALLWLVQPALGNLALFEFHPEALAVPALLWAIASLDAGRARAAFAAACFALLTREDAALVVLALAGWALVVRRPRLAAALAAAAAVSLLATFAWLKPRFGSGADYASLYRDWGAGPAAIAKHLARDPLGALARLVSTPGDPADARAKQLHWLWLLGPWAGLPLLAPLVLLAAAPVWAEHFLAWRPEQHTILYQYTALVLPVVAAAAVFGLTPLARARPRRAGAVLALAFGFAALAHAAAGPFAPVRASDPPRERARPDGRDAALATVRERMLAALPAHGALAASFVFLPRLAARDSVHAFTHLASGHYTFSARPYPGPRNLAGLVLDATWDDALADLDAPARARLVAVLRANELHPVAAAGECLVFARAPRDTVPLRRVLAAPAAGDSLRALAPGFAFAGGASGALFVAPGGTLPVRLRWLRTAPGDTTWLVELALVNAAGDDVAQQDHLVGHADSPPGSWPEGRVVEESIELVVPQGAPTGPCTLVARPGRLTAQAFVPVPGTGGEPLEWRLARVDVSATARR